MPGIILIPGGYLDLYGIKTVLDFPGPTPNVDIVLSICLQSDQLTGQSGTGGNPTQMQSGKAGIPTQLSSGPTPATSELSGSSKSHSVRTGLSLKPTSNRQYGKRKELNSMCIIHSDYILCLCFLFSVFFFFFPI